MSEAMRRLGQDQLERLRALHAAATAGEPLEPETVRAEVRELAALTPAWVAPHQDILLALGAEPLPEPECPLVVDLPFPSVGLTRAEWVDGGLFMELAPVEDEPGRKMMFRVAGSEPRIWDVHGPDGTRVEHRMPGLFVRTPIVTGRLELTPGSY